jgi:hypothetical protein
VGWVYVGIGITIPILIAIGADIAARRTGRPVQVDPALIKLRKGTLRKRGHGIGGSKQQQLYSYGEKWDASERPRRLND